MAQNRRNDIKELKAVLDDKPAVQFLPNEGCFKISDYVKKLVLGVHEDLEDYYYQMYLDSCELHSILPSPGPVKFSQDFYPFKPFFEEYYFDF